MASYVKQIVLGVEGDEDATAALTPQQIVDQLIQIDIDDLMDVKSALDTNLEQRTTAHGAGRE